MLAVGLISPLSVRTHCYTQGVRGRGDGEPECDVYIPLECISTTLYIFICNAFVPEVLFNAYHFQIIAT